LYNSFNFRRQALLTGQLHHVAPDLNLWQKITMTKRHFVVGQESKKPPDAASTDLI
jgi:hypothetical protein